MAIPHCRHEANQSFDLREKARNAGTVCLATTFKPQFTADKTYDITYHSPQL